MYLNLSRLAVGGQQQVDSLAILKQTLNGGGNEQENSISVKKTRVAREISYCPDNTCDLFKAPSSAPQSALADFAFTYLFYASGDFNLRDFVTKTGRPYSRVILDRNRAGCTDDEETALASCVLRSLGQRYSIRVFFVRYDEGARSEGAVDLAPAVAVDQLKRIRAWQIEQWRSHS